MNEMLCQALSQAFDEGGDIAAAAQRNVGAATASDLHTGIKYCLAILGQHGRVVGAELGDTSVLRCRL